MVRSVPLAALAALSLAASPSAGAATGSDIPPEPGTYWEQTTEMQMTGFAMPAQKSKVCLPKKGADEQPPPQGSKEKCKVTDMKRSGSRMTWKMKCEDGSTGEGDITWEKDSFKGTMAMRTQGQEMNIKTTGRKVGGDCDAAELKRQVAATQRQVKDYQEQSAKAQAEQCEDAAGKMKLPMFVLPVAGIPAQCKDPAKLCAGLDSRSGLVLLRKNGEYPDARAKAEKLCKKDLAPVVEKHCAAAEKERGQDRPWDADTTEYVFAYCPDLAKAVAKKECAGRKFTSLPPAQRDFCTRFAEQRMSASDEPAKADKKSKKKAADDEEAPPKQEDLKSKIMKGLLPF